jgi:hypothetical protein
LHNAGTCHWPLVFGVSPGAAVFVALSDGCRGARVKRKTLDLGYLCGSLAEPVIVLVCTGMWGKGKDLARSFKRELTIYQRVLADSRTPAVDCERRTIWIADAHRDDGKRFVVHADEKLTAFLELERAICLHLLTEQI